jgi:hypothetical protein
MSGTVRTDGKAVFDVRLGFDADEQASLYGRADRAGSRH